MRKNKLHTSINIVGMAVAFACSMLLLVMVYHEFSFEDFHANKSRLFKLYRFANGPEGLEVSGSMAYPTGDVVKSEDLGIEKCTRIKNRGKEIRYKEKTLEQSIQLVDDDFFSMFSFPVIKGAASHPLANTGNVVLSETVASSLFGTEEPVGKSIEIKVGGKWNNVMVSAILKDAPKNTAFNYSVLARTELDPTYAELKNEWNSTHHSVYVQLKANASVAAVNKQLGGLLKKYNVDNTEYLKNKGFKPDADGNYAGMKLLPVDELHFNADLGEGSVVSKSFLYILLLVACVIVLIACFNFINLNIGLSFTRTKEIGIRKCLGAGKRQVWMQVWGESLLTVLASMIIAVVAAIVLMGGFNKLMQSKFDASLLYRPSIVASILLMLLLVSLLASGYPSYIMGKLKTVEILKGKLSLKKPGIFRNALIVAQFAIAIILICTTVIIYQQFQHLRNAPLGYSTSSLISVPIKQYDKGNEIVQKMRLLLADQPSVTSVSGADVNLGIGTDGSTSRTGYGFEYNGKSVNTDFMMANYDILKTLDIQAKEGRDFSSAYVADTTNSVIITESMAKQLGEKNVLGLSFFADSSRPKWTVVGVIPDFHLYSMYEKNEPLTICMTASSFISYALVRVKTQDPATSLQLVKQAYAQAEPNVEFKGSFVNENIERWYTNEKRLSSMFSIASLVAIVLSCMGLFGMAFIIIRQRVKEIGVRKVLGASVSGIAALVTKEFIRPVVIALVIAAPLAWWAMHQWLQEFTYRINIHWWVFALAGIMAILIAILTVSFHAVKAAVANPVKSLRTE